MNTSSNYSHVISVIYFWICGKSGVLTCVNCTKTDQHTHFLFFFVLISVHFGIFIE